jgi:hypothetical protein
MKSPKKSMKEAGEGKERKAFESDSNPGIVKE